MYNIENRRYIGNKIKLLPFINEILKEENIKFSSFADIFAGTGIVSENFLSKNKDVIINDNLYSNFVLYNAWFSKESFNNKKINDLISYYNSAKDYIVDNYFSNTFSNTYFSYEDALTIGSIRTHLNSLKNFLTQREFYIILSSLLYTTDKIANTVGHYEAFLNKKPTTHGVQLKMLNLKNYSSNIKIFQEDANILIKKIYADILYIDPPYNSRQYINFYHLLENLAEWKCPIVYGKTLKMERNSKKSVYSTAKATSALKDLIKNSKSNIILLSYNNTYNANSEASINKISHEDIISILSNEGKVKEFSKEHMFFNSGKTKFSNHKEYLYICKR